MPNATTTEIEIGAPAGAANAPVFAQSRPSSGASACYHCGTPVRGASFALDEKSFCCAGCLTVFQLLTETGLTDFYRLGRAAGVRVKTASAASDLQYLDDPAVRRRLVDYADDRATHVTFRVPAMHCIACVWLLENLFRLNPGIGRSRVNFPRKEVSIVFENSRTTLAGVVGLLNGLGYEPDLKFSDLEARTNKKASRRLWLQLGVAGFAFGNIMLLSIASYFGLDAFSGAGLRKLFGVISLVLALPVLIYSAADYWRAAWLACRRRVLTIDVPIAAGIIALAARSIYEVVSGMGVGYFDSLCGLLFFLLCGKWFQKKTYDRLAFDLDYKSFFPLAVRRKRGETTEQVALSQLQIGDRLVIRNGEIIPADAILMSDGATVDYSFVTGESEPVEKVCGDHLFAGGRLTGGAVEVETVKEVSQSYLASLWNQEAFRNKQATPLDSLTNNYSRRFTKLVIVIALASAAVWWALHDPARAVVSFTSVLIVACPCALALAAPFALGAAQRVLARKSIFLKNASVIETLARVNSVVFDKTGTLTSCGAGSVSFQGDELTESERRWIGSLARHSTHPAAVRIAETLASQHVILPVRSFSETAGCGMEGVVGGQEIWMGSGAWLVSRGVEVPIIRAATGSTVLVACNGSYRGSFVLTSALRPETDRLLRGLAGDCEVSLLSGDNDRERERFVSFFPSARLHFNQTPLNKLGFIKDLQQPGRTVMMVGDGLNDSGALQQSDVGVAVVESIGAFSPASDVIMSAKRVSSLHDVLRFSRSVVGVVRLSFAISAIYNVIGISIAARGLLSPVVCAILMPLSSVTVVAFACGAANWLGRRIKGTPTPESEA